MHTIEFFTKFTLHKEFFLNNATALLKYTIPPVFTRKTFYWF